MTDLRAVRKLRRSTLRGYQIAVRLFCGYVTDPAYGWPRECETRFDSYPVQVVHEWNAAVHVQEAESDPSKRAFTRDELQALFDWADDQVGAVRAAGRKGWLAAFRDAALFKVAYGYGLRTPSSAPPWSALSAARPTTSKPSGPTSPTSFSCSAATTASTSLPQTRTRGVASFACSDRACS
jgi:hypothetical protein